MRFLGCPYRGPKISGFLTPKGTAVQVCNHPEVRGPCVIELPTGVTRNDQLAKLLEQLIAPAPVTNCMLCRRWKEPSDVIAMNLAALPAVDPKSFQPAEPMRTRVKHVRGAAPPPQEPAKPLRLVCQHLGKVLRKVDCLTCEGTQLKVFACSVYGECTISKVGEGVSKRCQDGKLVCSDFVPLTLPSPQEPRNES